MPTASPSMSPSTGVASAIWMSPENDSAESSPTPTPVSAETSGTAAPMNVRSMTPRTMIAMSRPAASPTPRMLGTPCEISVDMPTCTPSIGCAAT